MSNNVKVALLLAGQFRTCDNDVVKNSIKKFILECFDCDLYIETWSNRGVSFCHGNVDEIESKKSSQLIDDSIILETFGDCDFHIENYSDWCDGLNDQYKMMLQKSAPLHLGCLVQLYKKKIGIERIIKSNKKYDYVIVTRPDVFYWEKIPLEEYQDDSETVYNINLPGSYLFYPNRIYDIFYMSTFKNVVKMSEAYDEIPNLLGDPYRSNLNAYDCCKMLYIHAMNNNLKVDSLRSIPGDIFRGNPESTIDYYSNKVGFDKLQFYKTVLSD
jgi:hypothetical protein